MSFASHATFLLFSSPTRGGLPPLLHIPTTSSPLRSTAEYIDEIQKGSQVVLAAEESLEDDTEKNTYQEAISEKTRELVERIRWMLQNKDDEEISVSPYDTALVALVEDIGGSGQPQFPTSLDWISNNRFADSSWARDRKFLLYDRILNTLACVVALKTWKMHPNKCDKGLKFAGENIHKLEYENEDHMPLGLEVALPPLINIAKKTRN